MQWGVGGWGVGEEPSAGCGALAAVKGRQGDHSKCLIIVMFCSWRNGNINLEGFTRGQFYLRKRLEARKLPSILVESTPWLLPIYSALS